MFRPEYDDRLEVMFRSIGAVTFFAVGITGIFLITPQFIYLLRVFLVALWLIFSRKVFSLDKGYESPEPDCFYKSLAILGAALLIFAAVQGSFAMLMSMNFYKEPKK